MTVLTIFAREKVRKEWRPAFVFTHVTGPGLLLVLLWIHVSVARWYVVEAGVVYAAVLYERWLRRRKPST